MNPLTCETVDEGHVISLTPSLDAKLENKVGGFTSHIYMLSSLDWYNNMIMSLWLNLLVA